MAHRKLSEAERWQAVGMVRCGMSYRQTAERFNVSLSVIVRLKQRVNQTGSVKERQRTGKPLKTTSREDISLKRLARQQPFSTANTLRSRWVVNGRISIRTLNRRLTNARFRAKRPIKRPLLTISHKTTRLEWARDHVGWNIRSWQRVHWSDESYFCRLQLMAASAYGDRETQHFYRNMLWTQPHNWWSWCYCFGVHFSKM